jgi:hypothetical protein
VRLHIDSAVEDTGPLVGVEGRIVVVANPAHSAQVVSNNEGLSCAQSVEHGLATGGKGAGLDGIRLERRLLNSRGKVLVGRVANVSDVTSNSSRK